MSIPQTRPAAGFASHSQPPWPAPPRPAPTSRAYLAGGGAGATSRQAKQAAGGHLRIDSARARCLVRGHRDHGYFSSCLLTVPPPIPGHGRWVDSYRGFGVEGGQTGLPTDQGGALPHGLLQSDTQGLGAEEQGRASLDASGARVHLGPFNAAPLPQALTFSLVLSSDFAMAGEARPGPAQQGEKRHQGTAFSW